MLQVGYSLSKYSALISYEFPFFLKKVRLFPQRSKNPEIVPWMFLTFLMLEIV
jgi:hypothetical protein